MIAERVSGEGKCLECCAVKVHSVLLDVAGSADTYLNIHLES